MRCGTDERAPSNRSLRCLGDLDRRPAADGARRDNSSSHGPLRRGRTGQGWLERLAQDPRLRDPGPESRRRHGRRLQGPAARPEPPRRPEDDPAATTPGPSTSPASAPRPRRSPGSSTPTSSRSTRSASPTACRSSRWSCSTAAASTTAWRARPSRAAQAAELVETLARAIHAAHQPGSSTATSSRPTSCSPPTAPPRSPTSAWPSGSRRTAARPRPARSWARPATWPPSRPRAHQGRRPGRRRLRPGGDPLRAAHRPAAVQGGDADRDAPPGRRGRGRAAVPARARVARDLETICLKCLEKEPRQALRSARALADDLSASSRGQPIQARRTPLWERGVKLARRRPVAATLLHPGPGRDDRR